MNKSISCKWNHSVALKDDGTIDFWGSNLSNQCNLVYKSFTNVIGVACGRLNSVVLLENGIIECLGSNKNNQCDKVYKTFTGIIYVACGYDHIVALKDDGTLECWEIIYMIIVIMCIKLLQI